MQVTAALVVFQLGPLYCCVAGKTSEGETHGRFIRYTGFSVLLMCGGAYVASVLFDMNDYERIR